MATWQLQPITDETLARLPEVRYRRLGGWLVFFVITLALQGLSYLGTGVLLASGLVRHREPLTAAIALLLSLYFLPAALAFVTLAMLLMRKIAFRIPYAAFALYVIASFCIQLITGSGQNAFSLIAAAIGMALWVVYVFVSERVRVFCNQPPKRPVPMPAPEAEQAHQNANMPSGWTQPSSPAQYKED